MAQCSQCGKINSYNNIDHYTLDINEICSNLYECFNLKFKKTCNKCNNNLEFVYKFQSTPKILIIEFKNPKENKDFI